MIEQMQIADTIYFIFILIRDDYSILAYIYMNLIYDNTYVYVYGCDKKRIR